MTLLVTDVGAPTKYVLPEPPLYCCPGHSSVLTSYSLLKMLAEHSLTSEMLNLLLGSIQDSRAFLSLPRFFFFFPWQSGDVIHFNHEYSLNEVNCSFREKNCCLWSICVRNSRACSSTPYSFSYQVGVVELAFWESHESPFVEDEKHLVLSVWHPKEEMNLGLWH